MAAPKKRLGELLVEAGIIDEYQLRSALSHQQQWGGRLGKNLIELGLVTEERLVAFLAKLFRLPAIDFRRIRIMPGTLKRISPDIAKKHHVMPLFAAEEGGKKFLAVAMANPADLMGLDELEFAAGCKVRPVVGSDLAIDAAIHYYYENEGPPPYMVDAKHSTEMQYADLIAITREYLKGHKAPEEKTAEEAAHAVTTREQMLELDEGGTPSGSAGADAGDDSMIVFGAAGEKTVSLDGAGEATGTAAPAAASPAAAPAGGPNTDQVLRALINTLIEKGIITKADLAKKLK